MGVSAYQQLNNISKLANKQISATETASSTSSRKLANDVDAILYTIDNNINYLLTNIDKYELLYNNDFLAECKISTSVKNKIIEKIQRGYVDVK